MNIEQRRGGRRWLGRSLAAALVAGSLGCTARSTDRLARDGAAGGDRDGRGAVSDRSRVPPDGQARDAGAPPDALVTDGRDHGYDAATGDAGAERARCEAERPPLTPPLHPPLSNTGWTVVTVVGGAPAGFADGKGSAARLNEPRGLTGDAQGAVLYLSECQNQVVRRIEVATWTVSTVAGEPTVAGSVDGAGGAARFRCPSDLVWLAGSLYVADTDNGTIRRIELPSGAVTTFAGSPGEHGWADGKGNLARFDHPGGIAGDAHHLWVADSGNHVIREVDLATGDVTTLAGLPASPGRVDGSGALARFSAPRGLSSDGAALYVADAGNNALRRVELASREVTTLAGGGPPFAFSDGPWPAARFFGPTKLALDGGDLYVADTNNRVLRRVDLRACTVGTPAGGPGLAGAVDGNATEARFNWPDGLVRIPAGLVLVDMLSHSLRLVAPR